MWRSRGLNAIGYGCRNFDVFKETASGLLADPVGLGQVQFGFQAVEEAFHNRVAPAYFDRQLEVDFSGRVDC